MTKIYCLMCTLGLWRAMVAKVPVIDPSVSNQDIRRYAPIEFLRTTIIGFLKGLFQQCAIGHLHWDPDPSMSEMLILSEGSVKSEVIGARPAIVMSRSALQFVTMGLDDMVSFDMATSEKQKSVSIPGNIILHAISRNSVEAENIAFFTAEHIWILRDVLMKQGFMDIGQNLVIGQITPAGAIIYGGDAEEWFSVDVSVPFQLLRSARITPLVSTIVQVIDQYISSGSFATTTGQYILESKVETLGKLSVQSVHVPGSKVQTLSLGVETGKFA